MNIAVHKQYGEQIGPYDYKMRTSTMIFDTDETIQKVLDAFGVKEISELTFSEIKEQSK